MENPLEGFDAKLARADEHLETLDDEIADFLDTRPYKVRFEIDKEASQKVARIKVSGEPPAIRWGLLIGDCVHNMRSALDHLAWGLSRPEPPSKTEFPIFHDREEFERTSSGGGLHKIRGIKEPKARALIEAVQPCYREGGRPEGHPLYALRDLSNTDKHQVLHLAVAVISSASYWPGPGGEEFIDSLALGTFQDDAVIGRFAPRPGESEAEMNVGIQFGFDIAFDKGGPASGWHVAGGLRRIRECIRADLSRPFRKLIEAA